MKKDTQMFVVFEGRLTDDKEWKYDRTHFWSSSFTLNVTCLEGGLFKSWGGGGGKKGGRLLKNLEF